jgi:hypothetical protein
LSNAPIQPKGESEERNPDGSSKNLVAHMIIVGEKIELLEEYYEKLSLHTEKLRVKAARIIDRLESLVSYSHKKDDPNDTSKDPLMNKTYLQN